MIKLTHVYLVGMITASLLVGCGGSGDSDDENNDNDDGTGTPPTTTQKFTANVLPVLNDKCKRCHGRKGNFTITTADATYANMSDLKASVLEAGHYLLAKGSHSISHGGGKVISTKSSAYQIIKSWVDAGADFN